MLERLKEADGHKTGNLELEIFSRNIVLNLIALDVWF